MLVRKNACSLPFCSLTPAGNRDIIGEQFWAPQKNMGPWLSWESAAFASRRPRVRIPSGPPNRYWTNTYFFSGGFAVKCSLWSATEKHRLGSDPETALFLYFWSVLKLYICIPSMLRRGVLWWLSCIWISKRCTAVFPHFQTQFNQGIKKKIWSNQTKESEF